MQPQFIILLLFGVFSTSIYAVCPVGAPRPAGVCGNPEFERCTMAVGAVNRDYCIHIPSQPTSNLPVIFAFHGGNQHASDEVEVWDKHTEQGIVIVALQSLESEDEEPNGAIACKRKWRTISGRIPTWADLSAASALCTIGDNKADLDFVNDLAQGISNNLQVSNFYAVGFSSGASMVYQLFITNPFARQFSGFAAISNTIGEAKKTAALGGAGGGYTANTDRAKPFLFVMGTADKLNVPVNTIFENAAPPTCTITTNCTLVGASYDCTDAVKQAVLCWHETSIWGNKHKLVTNRADNIAWFVTRNRTSSNPIISLYPNLGSYGKLSPQDSVDRTMVLRQDFLPTGDNSEPFSAITVVDGGHTHPGKNGDYPPCVKCDIDVTEAILQFWRANAGFRSLWK